MSEFKKGDYIVLLEYTSSGSYIKDHIYKQEVDRSYLTTELDSMGDKHNGWVKFSYKEKNWRYADLYEIEEYEKLGKPYDTSKLIDKVLEVEALIDKWSLNQEA